MLKIELNKELDKEVYLAFNDGIVGGVDFGKKITADHPNISKNNYSQYIDKYYNENLLILNSTLEETKKCFLEIKTALFSQLMNYFGVDYSKENFTCYLSIFNCNPRYIETKTFQVFYKRPYDLRKEVIAHELTHFAFYDYCHKLNIKDSKELWELSEIFNVIFLNLEPIRSAIGKEELLFYPAFKDKLRHINKIWHQDRRPNTFILQSLKFLSE
ncbi:hypothetical protein IT397_03060 [Candidatus Nomurabacteria bacterium]|nr:hypothetical protein [Candidatus Nomurabacteria bacterium]